MKPNEKPGAVKPEAEGPKPPSPPHLPSLQGNGPEGEPANAVNTPGGSGSPFPLHK